MEDKYTSKTVQDAVGLTRQRIDYLIIRDVVTPYKDSTGTGSYRSFSYSNLIEFKLAKLLLGPIKLSRMNLIKYIIELTKKNAPEYFKQPLKRDEATIEPRLVVVSLRASDKKGGGLTKIYNLEKTFELIKNQHTKGRPFFILSLEAIRAEMIQSLK